MKFKRILLTLLALGGLSPSAWAEDEPTVVYLKPDVSKALSIEDIQNDDLTFVIMNSSNQVLYIESGDNYSLATLDDVVSGDYITMAFKMESVNDTEKNVEGYMFQGYAKDLTGRAACGGGYRYLNSQPSSGGVLFGYSHWTGKAYGTDANYCGLWTLESSATGTNAYSIKNVGTSGYLTGASAAYGTSAVDWFFYPISITNYTTNNDIVNITDLVATWSGKSETSTAAGLSMGGRFQKTTVGAGDVITQKITGLKNGTYEVTLYAGASRAVYSDCSVSSDEGSGLSEVFANRVSQGIDVVTRKKIDSLDPITFEVAVLDGTLTYGIRNIKAAGNWFVLKAKSIVYTSESISTDVYKELIAEKKTIADEITGDMNAEVKNALNSANSAAETTNLENKTSEELGAIYDNLVEAIDNANASVTAYASAKSALTKVYEQAQSNSTNVLSSDAYETYYTTPGAKYDAGTLTTEEAATLGEKGFSRYMLSAWDNNEDPKDYYLNTWSTEGNSDGSNFTTPFYEYWVTDGSKLAAKTLTATVTGLTKETLYSVSAWTRVRVSNTNATGNPTGITLQVGEGTPVDVCTGSRIGTSQLFVDEYTAVGKTDSEGNLTIKYIVADGSDVSWLAFKNLVYKEAGSLAKETEVNTLKESVEAAIKDYESNIGLEEGEYVPYANISAYHNLKKAKTLLSDANVTADSYSEANTLYSGATLTKNEKAVNGVYDGDFSIAANNSAPFGWRMSNNTLGGAYHSRVFNPDDKGYMAVMNNTKSGFFMRFDGTYSDRGSMYYYGEYDEYRIPLKANKVYYLKFDYAGWGYSGKPLNAIVNGTIVSLTTLANIADANNNKVENVQHFYHVFKVGDKDVNGTISFQVPGSDDNKHMVVVSNFELFSIPEETRSVAVGQLGTVCLPYSFTAKGAIVYSVEGAADGVVTLKEVTETTAGVAYVFKATDATQTFEYGDNVVSEPVSGTLTGVFSDTKATAGTYVLQNQEKLGQKFYIVAENKEPTIPAYRAYLTVPTSSVSASYRIVFDGTVTAIDAVNALVDGKAEIYDLNGRKLNTLQKGINIVNGVKVYVK